MNKQLGSKIKPLQSWIKNSSSCSKDSYMQSWIDLRYNWNLECGLDKIYAQKKKLWSKGNLKQVTEDPYQAVNRQTEELTKMNKKSGIPEAIPEVFIPPLWDGLWQRVAANSHIHIDLAPQQRLMSPPGGGRQRGCLCTGAVTQT